MDKKCKAVHQPHYDTWRKNQEYDSKILITWKLQNSKFVFPISTSPSFHVLKDSWILFGKAIYILYRTPLHAPHCQNGLLSQNT